MFTRISEAANTLANAAVSRASRGSTASDVARRALRFGNEARNKTFNAWTKVCGDIKRSNALLIDLKTERDLLSSETDPDTKVKVPRKDVLGKLPLTYRTTTVRKRLVELSSEIQGLENQIRSFEEDKEYLRTKLDEIDACRSTTQQGALLNENPEYANMHDFDGILNES